ncbi:MAG TPA: mandelate racemase/muconate lactonizing enzyme family protein [Bryobacteraceae bacterium]|nr:mandelate racemase/muconate lactonizing enzyme family protein [Bryobacteraceae bacterium]
MRITRRNFLQAALAMPIGASFARYEALAAPAQGLSKITAIRALQLKEGRTLIRVDTDAGLSGFGECGANGPVARNVIAAYNGAGRLPNLGLIGKDPLAIQVHFHNMFYAYPQRGRQMRVLGGIDMALWDLAGKILNQPVSKLLGGNFRDEILLYSHAPGGDYLSKEEWRDRAQRLKSDPRGFQAFKVDIHHALGINMQEYTPSIGTQEARRIYQAYTLAREAFGDDIGIDVHCHCELDVPSAIKVAQAVEHINPLFFEDPLAPEWSDSWTALRRATRVPIMTGENMELAEWAIPFLQNQAVDIFQPDIINSGGITGVKMIADLAARYRIPIALHNVSGLMLNLASQQLAAAVFNCPRIECAAGADKFQWAVRNPIHIANGRMKVTTDPGLGVELNQDYLKANKAESEPWWG